MTDATPTSTTTEFEIAAWDSEVWHESPGGPKLSRATIRKRFTGPLEGESVAEFLGTESEGGRGYVAAEVVEGVLDGRRGTFVIQHGGIDDGSRPVGFGDIVPGSGTGELAGIRGEARFEHDAAGARLTVTYVLSAAHGG